MSRLATSRKRKKPVSDGNVSETRGAAVSAKINKLLSCLKIEPCQVDLIQINSKNARVHSERQINQISASIAEFGFLVPILVDEKCVALAGHGRLEAAKRLKLHTVPTIVASHLTSIQKRAYMLADNRLAELSKWDEDILGRELSELADCMDLDLEITGFSTIEIDHYTLDACSDQPDPDDDVDPIERIEPAISKPGDIWRCGNHRIICGDAADKETWKALLEREHADLVVTDPPYNVPINGHVSGLGKIKHREFPMASGEMSSPQFENFLHRVIANLISFSRDGAIHYIFMDWRHQRELLAAALPQYGEYKNLCVWDKTNAGMGSFYRSQHELVHVFKVGTASHINNFALGVKRYRTNVWAYPGVNTFKRDREEELALHPTVKPVAMIDDALKDCSNQGDIIVDAFGGSGTTLISAERTRRCARLIELDPLYVDATVRRWQRKSKEAAVLIGSGEPFIDVAERRLTETAQEACERATRRPSGPRRRKSMGRGDADTNRSDARARKPSGA